MNLFRKKLIDGSSLENISKIFSSEIKTIEGVNFNNNNVNDEIGNAPSFVGVVSSIDTNTVSPIFKEVDAVYVLLVNSKSEPIETNTNSQQRLEIQSSKSSGIFYNSAMKVLKQNADIVDERIKFY